MSTRAESDEYYVIDLAEQVTGTPASRQHTFVVKLFDQRRTSFALKRKKIVRVPERDIEVVRAVLLDAELLR